MTPLLDKITKDRKGKLVFLCVLLFISGCDSNSKASQAGGQEAPRDWTHYIRTAGHGLNKENIDATIQDAVETNLFGIQVDNDIPGRYESFLDPTEKLEALELIADRAHEVGNYAFVYIAGLECITANADSRAHSFFKDHPDWVQRDINDRPAMFGGGDAFWISEGDEDVWISPYATAWRERYMEHVRQIAGTGIDGIFVDIPYWMTHFDGWEDTWASFDEYTVAAFKSQTGIDAKTDIKLGDYHDPNFRKWIDFRMETLTNFMADVDKNAKLVNPHCKTIAEIYPGLGEEAVRVGADVYGMYSVVDVIAHEYSGGGGNAASKNPKDWFNRMVGMYTFRAFAEDKATLMLSYSWDHNKVEPMEPMKNLALSNVMAGTNHWDARGHVMSGSNDIETRKDIYNWIAANEKTIYDRRTPISPIGLYFSPKTRNYDPDGFMESYQGMMNILLQGHLEFQVITPRTLKEFKGEALILPDVQYISDDEIVQLKKLIAHNVKLIITGETGKYDDSVKANGQDIRDRLYGAMNGVKDSEASNKNYTYYEQCPGKTYTDYLNREFNESAWSGKYRDTEYYSHLQKFKADLIALFNLKQKVEIEAAPFVSSQIAQVNGKPHVFLANFSGLKSDELVNQTPQDDIKIHFYGHKNAKVYYLPYLGKKQELSGDFQKGKIICTLPPLIKGGVVWLEE